VARFIEIEIQYRDIASNEIGTINGRTGQQTDEAKNKFFDNVFRLLNINYMHKQIQKR